MHKKNILNLLLFIAALSLAAVIYFSEESKQSELARLSNIEPSTITAISIRHNKNATKISKNNNQWLITKPVDIDANNFRINSLLELLNAPVHNKYSTSEVNLKSIGLDQAETTISLDDKLITFGITNPATGLRYIKLDNHVYTIEDVFYPLISSNFSTLVSLNLLPATAEITKLILPNQTIQKDNNGFWASNTTITADNINRIIDGWQQQQAFGVHQYYDRSSSNIKTPEEVFIYLESQEQPIRYLITDTDPWIILARPEINLEYHLDLKTYDKLTSIQ